MSVVKVKRVGIIDFKSRKEKNGVGTSNDLNGSLIEKINSEFNERFPYYNEIVELISKFNKGISDDRINGIFNSVILMGRQTYPGFSIEHVLLPYLFEKDIMGILSEKERKIYNEIIMFATGSNESLDSPEFNASFINYLKECFGLNSKLNIDLCIVKDELELINFFRNFKFTTSYVLSAGTSKSVNPGLRIVKDKK